MPAAPFPHAPGLALNESPSEKEGKWATVNKAECMAFYPSMKVPPKRKGNVSRLERQHLRLTPSMKVPPKRKGNLAARSSVLSLVVPSMKVPPKR
ncbi:hypothetical protein, partial [Rothia sp. HMSC064F07]|uniref:hypothetical protein n=1 Tax=Rothia sp. HMSC064F07 TaxID=1715191 RepID=UPI001AF02184